MYNIYYATGDDIGIPELINIIEVVKIKLQIVHFHMQRALLYLTCFFFKVLKQFRCFFGKIADEGENPLNNPDIYNVEEDNRLSPG
jgi:hypothetical protein